MSIIKARTNKTSEYQPCIGEIVIFKDSNEIGVCVDDGKYERLKFSEEVSEEKANLFIELFTKSLKYNYHS